ncbi:MAG: hypothetical protein DUD30_00810 [Lactobacillus sp.]|nr:MAG: hypothetical protein DUD30_00810 [Lactobacillus sp.]
MFEVRANCIQIGDKDLVTYSRDVYEENTDISVEAGTAEDYEDDSVETFASIICYEGDVMFAPATDRKTGKTKGFAIKTESSGGRDALIKGLRFLLNTLEEERAEVND